MTAFPAQQPADPPPVARPRRKGDLRRRFGTPAAVLSLIWIAVLLLFSLAPGLVAQHDPIDQDLSQSLSGPSSEHWLGTDRFGRDLLARLIFGTGDVLLASAAAVSVALVVGVPLGLIAGYSRGRADVIISRIADGLFSLPAIIIVLAAASLLGNNLTLAMMVFGFIISAGFIRLVRASTKAIRSELFVDAGRVQGLSTSRILSRHILPNAITPVIVQATLGLGLGVLAVAGLSFLGLGPAPPAPTWGGMVTDATELLAVAQWQMVPPGLVIILTVLSFNFLGDALTDRPTRHSGAARADRSKAAAERPALSEGQDAPPTALLEVQDLTLTTTTPDGREVTLISEVSFSIGAGESVALVGESGCGKSLTARAVLGMLASGVRMADGHVWLEGSDVAYLSEAQWSRIRGSRIAYIAQDPLVALDPSFSVESLLVEAVRRHNRCSRAEARQKGAALLAQVGLPHPESIMKRYPHQLSGGIAQRVAIALALTGSPELLVADEPTTALDVTVQAEILDLLRSLQEQTGLAVLLVTHDLGVVADFCSRAVVMYAGQIIEQAPVEELFNAPSHPYTALLIAATPHEADRGQLLPTIEGVVPPPGRWPTGCHFAPRCPISTDACTQGPIPLEVPAAAHESRCLFADDVHAGEVSVIAARTPAEHTPAEQTPVEHTPAEHRSVRL